MRIEPRGPGGTAKKNGGTELAGRYLLDGGRGRRSLHPTGRPTVRFYLPRLRGNKTVTGTKELGQTKESKANV